MWAMTEDRSDTRSSADVFGAPTSIRHQHITDLGYREGVVLALNRI